MRKIINLRSTNIVLLSEWALLAYVILGSVFCYLLPLPELAKSILSLPSWLILPYFLGKGVRLLLYRLKIDFHIVRGSSVLSLILGIYSLIVLSFLLDLLGLSIVLENLYVLILCGAFVYLVYKTLKRGMQKTFYKFSRLGFLAIAFCLLVSFIPAMISRSVFPFPYGTIETISISFEQYQPALRFMEHGYLQHYRIFDYVSLSFSSQLFNIDPISFIWSASFLMMAIYSVGLFLFSFSLSKSKVVALLTALVGSFLNMNVFRDIPTLFRSNVFMYIFFPLTLYLTHRSISRRNYRAKDVILTLTLLGVIVVSYVYLIESNIWQNFVPPNLQYPDEWQSHVWIPAILVTTFPIISAVGYVARLLSKKNQFLSDNASILLLTLFFFFSLINPENIAFILFTLAFIGLYFVATSRKMHILLYVFVVFVFAFILIQNFVTALPVSNPFSSVIFPQFAGTFEPISFSQRFQWLFETNLTAVLIIALIFGISAALFSAKRENLLVVSAFSLALFLYFSPEAFAYRLFKEMSPMMAYVISVGLVVIFGILVDRRKMNTTIFLSVLMIAVLLPNLIIPVYQRHYDSFLGQPIISDYENEAAMWLKDNTAENSLIISDFGTMQLLASLSNKMLPTARNYLAQGLSDSDQQTIWYIKELLSGSFVKNMLWDTNQSKFWETYGWGKGESSVSIDYANHQLENGALSIEVVEGNNSNVGVIHEFSETQNWSNASFFYYNWYGRNTNNTWSIIIAAPDDINWFYFSFVDSFTGWNKIEVPLAEFSQVGFPSWDNISYMAIRSSEPHLNTWLLGEVGLYQYGTFKFDSTNLQYLVERIDSTDRRYCETEGISWKNCTTLIILTPRTLKWVQQTGISEIWFPPNQGIDPKYLDMFRTSASLELTYSLDDEIYIFKVK
jgi:hypothetical protein